MTSPPTRTRSRRTDAAANAQRIADAARQVFRGSGPQTLDRIAETAGVGIATLYRHYPTRDDLVAAVVTRLFDTEVLPLISRESESAADTLVAVAQLVLELVDHEPALVSNAANFTALTDEHLRRFTAPFAELLAHGQRIGEFRLDLQPQDIPQLLIMLIAGLSTPGCDSQLRHRYLVLFLDALAPSGRRALPPLPAGEGLEVLRTGIGSVAAVRTTDKAGS